MGEHKIAFQAELSYRPRLQVVIIKFFRILWGRGPEFFIYKIIQSINRRLKCKNLKGKSPTATGAHWDAQWQQLEQKPLRLNWWDSPFVVSAVYKKISPDIGGELGNAALTLLQKHYPNRKFSRAFSIGCGAAFKEMLLLKAGLVQNFDLFELSEGAIETGLAKARELGLESRINFHNFDPFSSNFAFKDYDLCYWNNSLHHMVNTDKAICISREALKPGGVIYIEDYVGASRFQWSHENMKIVNRVYKAMPREYKKDPLNPGFSLPRNILTPLVEDVAQGDPTEAIDSSNILAAVARYFPNAILHVIGGAIFHPLLNQCIANFDESNPKDLEWLSKILAVDEASLKNPAIPPHYAIAMSAKDAS